MVVLTLDTSTLFHLKVLKLQHDPHKFLTPIQYFLNSRKGKILFFKMKFSISINTARGKLSAK